MKVLDNICSQVIRILSDEKPIFHHNLIDKCIITVSDLLSENSQFLDWNQAKEFYSLTDRKFMKFAGIMQSIPSTWKRETRRHSVRKRNQT